MPVGQRFDAYKKKRNLKTGVKKAASPVGLTAEAGRSLIAFKMWPDLPSSRLRQGNAGANGRTQ